MRKNLTYADCEEIVTNLMPTLSREIFDGVYGIPKGGVPIALMIAVRLKLPILDTPTANTLIVDDLVDSGRTIAPFIATNRCAVLFIKPHSHQLIDQIENRRHLYFGEITRDWIVFPWEAKELPGEDAVVRILEAIGENPTREGLLDTPKRVVKSWQELYAGYQQCPEKLLKTTFTEGTCKEMVISKDIKFQSMCEHHMLPFYGTAHFGYLPSKKVVGLSKISRLVDMYARRLQIQERMTTEIADTFMKIIEPNGCMLVVEAHHACMSSRGVKKSDSIMTTSAIRGAFTDLAIRSEFLSMIGRKQ